MGVPEFFQTDDGILIVLHKHSDEWLGAIITDNGIELTRGTLNHIDTAEPMELVNARGVQGFEENAQAVSYCLTDAQGYLGTLTTLPHTPATLERVVNSIVGQLEALTTATRDLYTATDHEENAA